MKLFTGWRNKPQNLRDSKYEIENTYYNFRNWNNDVGHRYQFVMNKSPFTNPFAFTVKLVGKNLTNIHIDFLWFRLFYSFTDIEGREYGFSFWERSIHLYWGYGSGFNMGPEGGFSKIFYMPWNYGSCVESKLIAKNGKWIDSIGWDLDKLVVKEECFPYSYTLESGEVQKRTATVSVSRRVWYWNVFKKLKIGPKIDSTTLDVSFDGEVGERTGSWKGGTIGCSYEMLKGESTEQTLRRMEKERKFT